jgi:hypothetical protein
VISLLLLQDFGFCWGVERSIALAYEAVEQFPDRKLHITNELIHNPEVNDQLTAKNVQLVEKLGDGTKNFENIQDGDVVILPAFGASYEEMDYFNKKVSISYYFLIGDSYVDLNMMYAYISSSECGSCRYHLSLGVQGVEYGRHASAQGLDVDYSWKVWTRRNHCYDFLL